MRGLFSSFLLIFILTFLTVFSALSGTETYTGTTTSACQTTTIPDGATNIVFTLTMTGGDYDLYYREAACPTTGLYDCRPYSSGSTTESCGPYSNTSGAAKDYYSFVDEFTGGSNWTLTVTWDDPPTPCAGTPTAGTSSPASQNIESGSSTSVTVSGYTSDPGINFQWQESSSSTGPWSDVTGGSGATTDSYTTPTISSDTYYRCVVTCTNSGLSANSSVAEVLRTFCEPSYSNGGGSDNITNVTIGALNDSPPANSAPYYFDRTSVQNAVPNLAIGSTVSLSLSFGTDGNQYNGVWVDFNNNGVFETSEFFTSNSNAGSSGTVSVSISVPGSAVPGISKMRVRGGDDSQPSSNQACGASNSTWGQALDYEVNLLAPAPTLVNSSFEACEVIAFNNIRYNSLTPKFALEGTPDPATHIEIELNTAADFSGTSYTEIVEGPFTGDYNVSTSDALGLPGTDNVIYYVRVRESKDNEGSWSPWSLQTWTYNYSSSQTPGYHFTTKPQFDQGNLVSTNYGNYIFTSGTGIASDYIGVNEGDFNETMSSNGDQYLTEGSSNFSGASNNYITVGSYYLSGQRQDYHGFRFTNFPVPENANILSSSLKVYAHNTGGEPAPNSTNPLYLEIVGVNQADVNAWSNSSSTTTGGPRWRVRNAVTVPWDITASWSDLQLMSSPDISAVIEDIVSNGGYGAGNAIGVIVDYTGGAHFSQNRHRYFSTGRRSVAYRPRIEGTFTNFENTIKFEDITLSGFGDCSKWDEFIPNDDATGCGDCEVSYRILVANTSTEVAAGSGTLAIPELYQNEPAFDLEVIVKRDNGTPQVNSFTFTTSTETEAALASVVETPTLVCEDVSSGWTYYLDPSDDTKHIMAIQWGGDSNQDAKCQATITVGDAGSYNFNEAEYSTRKRHASYIMERYWNVDLGGESLIDPVSIRFYYNQADVDAITNARNARLATLNGDPSAYDTHYEVPFKWFKTVGQDFDYALFDNGNDFSAFNHVELIPSSSGTENGVKYVEFSNITSFSGGSGGVGYAPTSGLALPVDLVEINAKAIENRYNKITWITASESNNQGFEVYRSSDGIEFETIGWVDGSGNSSTAKTYSFDDFGAKSGVSYYKVKQLDFDGQFEYFPLVSADLIDEEVIEISDFIPNPAEEKSGLRFKVQSQKTVDIGLYDVTGKLVVQKSSLLNKGETLLLFDTSALAPGMYTAKIAVGNSFHSKRLMIAQ